MGFERQWPKTGKKGIQENSYSHEKVQKGHKGKQRVKNDEA